MVLMQQPLLPHSTLNQEDFMKSKRHSAILSLIREYDIETQQELSERLMAAGFPVTQATISRDIRDLKLTKIQTADGRAKYAALSGAEADMSEKYVRVFREGFLSIDNAQNILVIRTVSGMAMAVAAALDSLRYEEIVGSIAGDDTIMSAIRTVEEAERLKEKLRRLAEA